MSDNFEVTDAKIAKLVEETRTRDEAPVREAEAVLAQEMLTNKAAVEGLALMLNYLQTQE